LKEKLSLEPSYRTAVRWLHELNFHLRVPQPWPERQNEEERKRFLKELRSLCADPTVELWFSDECGVEEDPRPRRLGFNRENGAPCRIWVIIYGAVAPQSGALFSLIV
jgi:hypothetical protein